MHIAQWSKYNVLGHHYYNYCLFPVPMCSKNRCGWEMIIDYLVMPMYHCKVCLYIVILTDHGMFEYFNGLTFRTILLESSKTFAEMVNLQTLSITIHFKHVCMPCSTTTVMLICISLLT